MLKQHCSAVFSLNFASCSSNNTLSTHKSLCLCWPLSKPRVGGPWNPTKAGVFNLRHSSELNLGFPMDTEPHHSEAKRCGRQTLQSANPGETPQCSTGVLASSYNYRLPIINACLPLDFRCLKSLHIAITNIIVFPNVLLIQMRILENDDINGFLMSFFHLALC